MFYEPPYSPCMCLQFASLLYFYNLTMMVTIFRKCHNIEAMLQTKKDYTIHLRDLKNLFMGFPTEQKEPS